jgi:hypothetical protein
MKRSTHLLERESSGGLTGAGGGLRGPGTRTVKIGTFGSRRLPNGKKSTYTFTVEEGGKIEPGPQFNSNTDQINGRTASGAMFGPGGYDDYEVTGRIVSADLGPELAMQGAEVVSGGGGSGNGGSGNGGSSGGGSGGSGSTGGGNDVGESGSDQRNRRDRGSREGRDDSNDRGSRDSGSRGGSGGGSGGGSDQGGSNQGGSRGGGSGGGSRNGGGNGGGTSNGGTDESPDSTEASAFGSISRTDMAIGAGALVGTVLLASAIN